jgi:cysteine synthase A
MNNLYKYGIGNTPIYELKNIEKVYKLDAKIYVKLEMKNPAGSIKDRIAYKMLTAAVKENKICTGGTVIEATSGNTGIGLAYVSKKMGYKCIIVMPDNMSKERITLIESYGAKVMLTPSALGMKGAIDKAIEINKADANSAIMGQFENENNPLAHYESTGPEIYSQTGGNVDIFVAGAGTGGTVSGVGKYLKEKNNNIKIYAMEPETSAVISGKSAGRHGIQGIGAGFIPKTLNTNVLDGVLTVGNEEAFEMCRIIKRQEDIFVGISSAANVCAAIKLAQKKEYFGKNIVTIFCDGGERYFSTGIFDEFIKK